MLADGLARNANVELWTHYGKLINLHQKDIIQKENCIINAEHQTQLNIMANVTEIDKMVETK